MVNAVIPYNNDEKVNATEERKSATRRIYQELVKREIKIQGDILALYPLVKSVISPSPLTPLLDLISWFVDSPKSNSISDVHSTLRPTVVSSNHINSSSIDCEKRDPRSKIQARDSPMRSMRNSRASFLLIDNKVGDSLEHCFIFALRRWRRNIRFLTSSLRVRRSSFLRSNSS